MKKFSRLIIVFLMFNINYSKAQFLIAGDQSGYYYDFNPDTTMTILWPTSYFTATFDLENDNIPDIQIDLDSYSGMTYNFRYGRITCLNSKFSFFLRRIDTTGKKVLKYFSAGDTIKFESNTITTGYLFANSWTIGNPTSWSFNDWVNLGDKYLGFMYTNGTNIEYGWIRLNVIFNAVTMKDYDINSNFAGVHENKVSKTKLFPNPVTNSLILSNNKEIIGSSFQIVNCVGQVVKEGEIESEQQTIDVSDLATGLYHLQLISTVNVSVKFIKE